VKNVVHHGWRLEAVCDQEFQIHRLSITALGTWVATIDAWPHAVDRNVLRFVAIIARQATRSKAAGGSCSSYIRYRSGPKK